jgi:hypothetical protein
MFITHVNDNSDKLVSGVNDTSETLSPVSLTPVNNIYFPGVVDTVQKKTKSLKFIVGVNDTAKKLFTGVNDTADKFFGGVSHTGDKRVLPILACLHLK